jgi:hypothetical protein
MTTPVNEYMGLMAQTLDVIETRMSEIDDLSSKEYLELKE